MVWLTGWVTTVVGWFTVTTTVLAGDVQAGKPATKPIAPLKFLGLLAGVPGAAGPPQPDVAVGYDVTSTGTICYNSTCTIGISREGCSRKIGAIA